MNAQPGGASQGTFTVCCTQMTMHMTNKVGLSWILNHESSTVLVFIVETVYNAKVSVHDFMLCFNYIVMCQYFFFINFKHNDTTLYPLNSTVTFFLMIQEQWAFLCHKKRSLLQMDTHGEDTSLYLYHHLWAHIDNAVKQQQKQLRNNIALMVTSQQDIFLWMFKSNNLQCHRYKNT